MTWNFFVCVKSTTELKPEHIFKGFLSKNGAITIKIKNSHIQQDAIHQSYNLLYVILASEVKCLQNCGLVKYVFSQAVYNSASSTITRKSWTKPWPCPCPNHWVHKSNLLSWHQPKLFSLHLHKTCEYSSVSDDSQVSTHQASVSQASSAESITVYPVYHRGIYSKQDEIHKMITYKLWTLPGCSKLLCCLRCHRKEIMLEIFMYHSIVLHCLGPSQGWLQTPGLAC